jgi:hypothetical protein
LGCKRLSLIQENAVIKILNNINEFSDQRRHSPHRRLEGSSHLSSRKRRRRRRRRCFVQ